MTADQPALGPYGLQRPVLADALDSLRRVHAGAVDELWSRLLAGADLAGADPGQPVTDPILTVMFGADSVTRLVARALQIRLRTFEHLSAVHEIIRSAS